MYNGKTKDLSTEDVSSEASIKTAVRDFIKEDKCNPEETEQVILEQTRIMLEAEKIKELCLKFGDEYNALVRFRNENNIKNGDELDTFMNIKHNGLLIKIAYTWKELGKIKGAQDYFKRLFPQLKGFCKDLKKVL
jgi:hypothetical protein